MFRENLVLHDDVSLELMFRSAKDYRLACLKAGRLLVEYSSARAYDFKSVEKLRYDFERDAENALRQS